MRRSYLLRKLRKVNLYKLIEKRSTMIFRILNDFKNMHTFFKIILVLIITGIGAAVTCGANLSIFSESTADYGFIVWFIEIIGIFALSIHLVFSENKEEKPKEEQNVENTLTMSE